MEQPQGYDTDVGELGNRLSGGTIFSIYIAFIFKDMTNAAIGRNMQML